ncbi:DUF58 domain-containing protein [Chitinilyticum piscinae]|uniref:DUF58 domain-containing protein n=1 Tax=Chitinilyticum piscinae TaxID=2866724 RepID=A0A8J7FZX4_9NEIS|nr:DUF58 domain-containing protein [Chitinilyticum piscinae]MBE9609410.1 DUF58 domain-containing protein [Chitinilyticum piscinae]
MTGFRTLISGFAGKMTVQPASRVEVIELNRRRIYILPTRYGLGLGLSIALLLIAAINYQLNLSYLAAFLLAGLAHSAMLHAFLNLHRLSIRAAPAQPVFAGEPLAYPLVFSNTSQRTRVQLLIAGQGQATQHTIEHLAAQNQIEALLTVETQRRGEMTIPRCKISSIAPTGWFIAWTYCQFHSTALVYPAPEPSPPPLPLAGNGDQRGYSTSIQGGDELAGLRPYQRGDMAQHIAWKQSARNGQLSSKLLEADAGGAVLLDWHDIDQPDTEARLSRLCAWILQAEAAGVLYTLALPGKRLGPGCGGVHRTACLTALALFPQS